MAAANCVDANAHALPGTCDGAFKRDPGQIEFDIIRVYFDRCRAVGNIHAIDPGRNSRAAHDSQRPAQLYSLQRLTG